MSGQNKVSGVVLAGGQAQRMRRRDKGLVLFRQRTLISYALETMAPLVDELLISANRNRQTYARFGYRVIGDAGETFEGPLAGILAAMRVAQYPVLLVMPCDSPMVKPAHLQRLLSDLAADADLTVAFDGERMHPVFLALKTHLQASLHEYLRCGERKLQFWLRQHKAVEVDFSDVPEIFANINTLAELAALEQAAVNPVF